jgi:hypothetical protein
MLSQPSLLSLPVITFGRDDKKDKFRSGILSEGSVGCEGYREYFIIQ